MHVYLIDSLRPDRPQQQQRCRLPSQDYFFCFLETSTHTLYVCMYVCSCPWMMIWRRRRHSMVKPQNDNSREAAWKAVGGRMRTGERFSPASSPRSGRLVRGCWRCGSPGGSRGRDRSAFGWGGSVRLRDGDRDGGL